MKKHLSQKGFTLVEILIVVVILAILAALVVPRLLSQTGKADIAEAQSNLGILRRGIIQYKDSTGSDVTAFTCAKTGCNSTGTGAVAALAQIGVSKIPAGKFGYNCDKDNCTAALGATPAGPATADTTNGSITVAVETGVFSCDGAKYALVDSSAPSKGCTLKA